MNGKGCGRKQSYRHWMCVGDICAKALRKTVGVFHDKRSARHDLLYMKQDCQRYDVCPTAGLPTL